MYLGVFHIISQNCEIQDMRLVYLGQTLCMKNAVLLKNFGLALWAGVLFVKQSDS